jgi:Fe-S-cluster-containing hydrogenase component 2
MPAEFSTLDHLWDTPLDTSGYTFNLIKMYRNGTMDAKDQEVNGFAFMKTSCMHCGDPSCVSACPVSAMTKDPVTGVVGYNPDKCIGCRYCVAACPFGIPKLPVRLAHRAHRQVRAVPPSPQGRPLRRLRRGLPDRRHLVRQDRDLLAEAKRRLAQARRDERFRAATCATRRRSPEGKPDGKGAMQPPRLARRARPELSRRGRQVPAARLRREGIRRHPGAQALRREFPEAGHARPAARRSAALSETIQHTLYGGLLMPFAVLGAMTFVAKRNVKPEDDESGKEGS